MNKNEFISYLRQRLSNYPAGEVDKAISFYTESLEDRIEDGMTEEEAVASLGNVDDIVKQIQSEMPINTIVKNKIDTQKKKMSGSTIALIVIIAILGFPIWFPILITAVSLIFAAVVTVFSLGIAALAVVFGLCIAGVATLGYCLYHSAFLSTGALIGLIGLILMGVGLLIPVTRFTIWLFKKIFELIKLGFVKLKKALV